MNIKSGTKTKSIKEILANTGVLDNAKIGDLTGLLESKFPTEELSRGDVNTLKATLHGLPKYDTARDSDVRYQDTINAIALHEANPNNYKGLKLRMLAELHSYLGAEDRVAVLGLMNKEAEDWNKKRTTKEVKRTKTTGENLLKQFNETLAEVQTSSDMQALKAMTTIDIFNSATKQRYEFAKSKGVLKEFGFIDKDGKETKPVYLDAPPALRKKVDAYRKEHAGEYISMVVDKDGQQRFDVKRKLGFRGTMEKIGSGMINGGHESSESAAAYGAGCLTREGIFLLARLCGLTNRATSEKNSVGVEVGKKAEVGRGYADSIIKPPPKRENDMLAGPSGAHRTEEPTKGQQNKTK